MKNFSNLYIFIFSSAMVIIVAALLSFVAEELKPLQERNVELEKKIDILRSVDMTTGMDTARNRDIFIEERFSNFISESFVLNSKGEVQDGLDAFEITKDLKAEIDKPAEERNLPVFVFETTDNEKNYIIPVRGKGLWGPIWGYVAIKEDFTTIAGTVFDHAKETPGLGAEINEGWFQAEFEGKRIFNEQGEFTGIRVVKGGADPNDPHSVDAVSGGTITSNGLQDMLEDCLSPYIPFFKQRMN